jgi:hypothetical protein
MADPRRLTISGNIHIKDFETFGSDEHCDLGIERSVVLQNTEYATVFTDLLGCGGECRTEVDIQAKVLEHGDILVNVYSRFFEGTTEVTDELEDTEKTEHFLVRKNVDTPLTHNLVNVDFPGNDISTVSLNFNNLLFED